jgi:hypothetical protein
MIEEETLSIFRWYNLPSSQQASRGLNLIAASQLDRHTPPVLTARKFSTFPNRSFSQPFNFPTVQFRVFN